MKMLKRYYRLQLFQTSPLHLSNGDSRDTDSDLMKDSRGLPFIPGTGLAGALRDLLTEEEKPRLFGYIDGEHLQASRVLVSDGTLPAEADWKSVHLIHRDGVGLDTFRGTAVASAKYDFEAVETELPYTAVLEYDGEEEEEDTAALDALIAKIAEDGLVLGGKTTRGYGWMKVHAEKRDFRFPQELAAWLSFSPCQERGGWVPVEGIAGNIGGREYRLSFTSLGAMAVRVYSTEPGKPDYSPLMNHKGQPVIPGTSWAGSFRHRMLEIAGEIGCQEEEKASVDALFGKLEGDMRRSDITFSQSELRGGKPYNLTRNALDRFTAGPAMSALYTAGYWNGGEGELLIRVREGALTPLLEQLLLAAVRDLNFGLMTVGGGAATGLGRVRVTRFLVDGKEQEVNADVQLSLDRNDLRG